MNTTTSQGLSHVPNVVNSWKDIARHLNRGVRTVQRWESDLGMPVHRFGGKGRGNVVAIRQELSDWITGCSIKQHVELTVSNLTTSIIRGQLRASITENNKLRIELGQTRAQLRTARSELMATIEKLLNQVRPQNAE